MKRIIFVLLLLSVFLIPTCSATNLPIYEDLPNPTDLSSYYQSDTILFMGDYDDDSKAIYKLYTDTPGTHSAKVIGLPLDAKGLATYNGMIYFTAYNAVYRTDGSLGLLNFSYSGHDEHFQRVADLDSNDDLLSIAYDGSFYAENSYDIAKFSPPAFNYENLFSSTAIVSLDSHMDTLIYGGYRSRRHLGRTTEYLERYDPDTGVSTIMSVSADPPGDNRAYVGFPTVSVDENKNIYATEIHDDEPTPVTFRQFVYNSTTDDYTQSAVGTLQTFPKDSTYDEYVYISYGTTIGTFPTVAMIPSDPATATVSTSSTYHQGDTAVFSYSIDNFHYMKEYTLELQSPTETIQLYNLSDDSGSVSYEFTDEFPSTYMLYLYEDGVELANTTFDLELQPLNTAGNISWDAGSAGTYTAGDDATISYSITEMSSVGDYTIKVTTPMGSTQQVYDITSDSGNVTYSFPLDAVPTAYGAFLYDGDEKLSSQHVYLENPSFNYSISFSKSQYSPGEWVVINYEGLTSDMELVLFDDQEVANPGILETWSKSGSGQVSFKLPDDYDQENINVVLKLYNENLASDVADIVTSDSTVLYGIIYDASTGQRIQDAHVTLNSLTDLSDSDGKYQHMPEPGNYKVTVSKDGYLPTSQWVVVNGLVERDFFLTPETADADVFGVVKDKETGDHLSGVTIFIDGTSYGEAVFTSSTGYFTASGLTAGQEYDISATLSGYEDYQSHFTATNNSTDLSFSMYPIGTGGDTDDPTGDDFSIDWESPDDAKSFAQEWTGVTWFILVVLFVVAAMGAKK